MKGCCVVVYSIMYFAFFLFFVRCCKFDAHVKLEKVDFTRP